MCARYAYAGFMELLPDFRGASWGMSKEEVKISEDLAPLTEGDGFITYGDRVMGLNAVVGYHFLGRALVEAGYAFRESLKGEHLYISEYRKLKDMLTGTYGEPSYDERACGGSGCFCADCSGADDAVACPIVYLCEWTTMRSVIRLVLIGEERLFDFGLLHRSKEHEGLVGGVSSVEPEYTSI